MSTYYYFHAHKQHEYFELTSGSWYPYLEDLYDVLTACTKARKSYKEFIKKLQTQKVFEYFYDDGAKFITADNEKYFLRPLYDWAYDKDIRLIDDGELYDFEVQLLCEKNNIKYERKNGWEYSDEIHKLLKKFRDSDEDWHTDMKCVGKLNYDDKIMANIGVSFERALSELKAGAVIWNKKQEKAKDPNDFKKYVYDKEKKDILILTNGNVLMTKYYSPLFSSEELLSDDWTYKYEWGRIVNNAN